MGSTFSRLKNWIAEVLNYADLNAEIDNILSNFTPAGMDDMSPTAAAYRLQTDPGEVGTESLPASLEQEIKRLRFVLTEIKGGDVDYWYESSAVSLTSLRTAIGGALQSNRISSGAHSTLSSAARFLVPNGAAASFSIDGSPTTFSYVINDTSYSINTDVVTSGVGLAPSSNNTCLVNDATALLQESTKNLGEEGTTITVDAMGSEITALVGKLCTFKVVHGGNTEYFLGLVKSTTQITNCYRGFFYDSTKSQVPRIAINDNDTITLHRTAWIFATTSQACVISYGNPTWSYTQPTSPNTGDYWYDMSVNYWKSYDSVSWITANAMLIGIITSTSAACVGARSFEFFTLPEARNNLVLEWNSVTQLQQKSLGGIVGVGSNIIRFNYSRPLWDITTDLESGYTEVASTTYYAYVTESGDTILSPLKPYDLRGSLSGWYHPYEIWRCIGYIFNDANSDILSYLITNLSATFDASLTQSYIAQPRNVIDNAEFRWWQRQIPTTLTSTQDDAYCADRWYTLTGGGAVNVNTAQVAEIVGTSPTQFVAQIRQADGTARQYGIAQIVEASDAIPLQGKTVTCSFWARTDGTEVTAIRAGIVEWTGTADTVTSDIVSSWAATPTLIANATFINTPGSLSLTSSWAQFSFTVTLGTTFNNLIFTVWTPSTEAQNDDFYITQVQCVESPIPAVWSGIHLSAQTDLARCQRFFVKSYQQGVKPGTSSTTAGAHTVINNNTASAFNMVATIVYKQTMRSIPTVTFYNPNSGATGTARSSTPADLTAAASDSVDASVVCTISTLPAQATAQVHYTATADL